jgi:hypothetical protein
MVPPGFSRSWVKAVKPTGRGSAGRWANVPLLSQVHFKTNATVVSNFNAHCRHDDCIIRMVSFDSMEMD